MFAMREKFASERWDSVSSRRRQERCHRPGCGPKKPVRPRTPTTGCGVYVTTGAEENSHSLSIEHLPVRAAGGGATKKPVHRPPPLLARMLCRSV